MFRTSTVHSLVSLSLSLVASTALGCTGQDDPNITDSVSNENAQQALAAKSLPPLPSPDLAVPAGNDLAFFFDAVGVQIYVCQTTASGYGWSFQAPEASLHNRHGRVVVKHYAGPTWEYLDGSKVIGAKIASFTSNPTAIPELLLQASSHDGSGRMSDVMYIQRLDTQGGLAPTTGCDADHVGVTVRVDYTATYYFYRAAAGGCEH